MDIGLPQKNGIETTVAIRDYETAHALAPIPIVAVTANTDTEVVNQCLSAGMLGVQAKPLMKETILQFLTTCHLSIE